MTDEEIKTTICSLFFNLCTFGAPDKLEILLNEFKQQNIDTDPQRCFLFVITVKIIIYCRDIMYGKGKREQSYALLYCLHKYYPETAWKMIKQFPLSSLHQDKNISVGCWRDIPGLCKYIKKHSPQRDQDPFIDKLVHYMNEQLVEDYRQLYLYAMDTSRPPELSLVAKWIPRERSRTSWLYSKFALDWFVTNDPYKLTSAKTPTNYFKAINKCKKDYRSAVSLLTSRLNIVEIYQCSHQWSRIDPKELNLHSLKKYHRAFFSPTTVNEMNTPDLDRSVDLSIQNDVSGSSMPLTGRNECYRKFYEYYTGVLSGEKQSKDCRPYIKTTTESLYETNFPLSCKQNTLSIHSFVKRALVLIRQRNRIDDVIDSTLDLRKRKTLEMQINVLNKEWENFSSDVIADNCIPIICMNYYLDYSHLGIACLYAKKSKRVLIIKNGDNLFPEDFITRITVDISIFDSFVDTIECLQQQCDISINNSIDAKMDLNELFYNLYIADALTKESNDRFIFISNINIYADIKTSMKKYITQFSCKGSVVFHYLCDDPIVVDNMDNKDNKENEILIVNSYSKATVKHITNYSFSSNFNMINHCLNVYSSAFFLRVI
jgi:hypothetical protein